MKQKVVDVDRLIIPEWMKKEEEDRRSTIGTVALEIITCIGVFAMTFALWIVISIWTGGI